MNPIKVIKRGTTYVSHQVVVKRKSRYLIQMDYVKGGIEYDNSKLQAIYYSEGRVAFTDPTQSLSITAPINGETKSFKAGTIIADNTYTGSANVTMQVSTNVQFLPGFFIEQGTAFNANIVFAAATSKAYEYVIRDHLGNGRIYFTDYNGNGSIEESNGEILQVGVKRKSRYAVIGKAHYDPWGYALSGNWLNNPGVDNQYLYNGKELNNNFGLSLYDYSARWMDPSIGRWNSIDSKSEKRAWVSPFNYTQNNPILRIDIDGALDDHYINSDGSIESVKTDDTYDRFFIQNTCANNCGEVSGYTQVAQLEKNDRGLVKFPSGGHAFGRYGADDAGGFDIAQNEQIGSGDHYLKPEAAADLFGVISKLTEAGLNMKFGDMSSSNGSDPGAPGEKHHRGHGHSGNLSGQSVDFRYVNTNGNSFQSSTATTSTDFSTSNNQLIYNTANNYGFTDNYQGYSGERMNNASRAEGHNDHGHLGLNYGSLNLKYVNSAPRN